MLQAWWPGTHTTVVWQQRGGKSPPPSNEPAGVWPQGCKQGPQLGLVGGLQHSFSNRDPMPAAEWGGCPQGVSQLREVLRGARSHPELVQRSGHPQTLDMCIAQRPRRTGSRLRRQTVALPHGGGRQGGGLWGKGLSSSLACSRGADDTQGTKRNPHRTWASPHCQRWGSGADPALCQGDTACCQPTSAETEPQEMLPAGHSALHCPQPRQTAREMGNFLADLYKGCSGVAPPRRTPCPEGRILLLMSQELQEFCGAQGQPAPAPLLLHAEGTQGCLYPVRPLQLRGKEKRDMAPIRSGERQVVKRTGGLYCCDHHGPSVLAPSWPMGKDRAIWGRHRGGPAASAGVWARGGGKGRKAGGEEPAVPSRVPRQARLSSPRC